VRRFRLAVILALLAACLGGCAAMPMFAAMDALNAAEAGKTGFDMAMGLNSRKSLELDTSPDAQAEARIRAALDRQGGNLRYAIPHVTQGQGYVVGTYADDQELERARKAMSRVGGVSKITLCLFREGSGPRRRQSDAEVRDNILRMTGIRTREVRVHVVEGNAVLIGRVRTKAEEEQLVENARIAGATSVRNYVRLYAANPQ
jgi:osmotically-inducible protein OsmY